MKLVDANVLIYAVNASSRQHVASRTWVDRALSGGETVAIPWICLVAFLRLTTKPGLSERPLSVSQATDVTDAWISRPNVITPEPGIGHLRRLGDALEATGTGGNLVNDAHLAALSIQLRATVVTFDNDFGRFPEVRWMRPAM